ncbi:hypothetical protein ACJMK2_043951 [Sinanodonta woodiana]|uniref:Uncharacterized protein n=1 Tax=Sinanodonta woodiana TaxID=1069815 RepID=A0ABD3VYH9_SINWO
MTAASSLSTASTNGNYKFPSKSSKSSRFSTATSTTTFKSHRQDEYEFSTLLKVYRKAFKKKVHQHSRYDAMTAHNPSPSPVSSYASKSVMFLQSRHTDKGSYVQRWKALRDRNQNLPNFDWNTKASGRAYQGDNVKQFSKLPVDYSRTYPYNSTQFPSLSKACVITKYSGGNKSISTESYRNERHKDKDKDRNINLKVLIHFSRWKLNTNQQREQSEPYKETKEKKIDYNALSKSLPNTAIDNSDVTLSIGGTVTGATKLMYQKFSKQKVLSDRFHATKEKDKNYANDQTVHIKPRENEHSHVHSKGKETEQNTGTINLEEKQTVLQKITREGSDFGSSVVVERKDNSSNMDGKTVKRDRYFFTSCHTQRYTRPAKPKTPCVSVEIPRPRLRGKTSHCFDVSSRIFASNY